MRSHMTIQFSLDLKLTATRNPVQASAKLESSTRTLGHARDVAPLKSLLVAQPASFNPEVPAEALSHPKKFRLWLAEHQGQFIGGSNDLLEIVSKLPKHPRLSDLIALEDPKLVWD